MTDKHSPACQQIVNPYHRKMAKFYLPFLLKHCLECCRVDVHCPLAAVKIGVEERRPYPLLLEVFLRKHPPRQKKTFFRNFALQRQTVINGYKIK
jgi:hypothetical protein